MFEALTQKIQVALSGFFSRGKLTEKQVKEGLRELKLVLLEADVNYQVVKEFIAGVESKAVGQEVLESITPAQQIVKIIHEELVKVFGSNKKDFNIGPPFPFLVMLVGLQGTGKTTTAVKLANFLKKKGLKPLLVAADLQRAAAQKQLAILAEESSLMVFSQGETPDELIKRSLEKAKSEGFELVVADTAGRLHLDENLMSEIKDLRLTYNPRYTLFVLDSMVGQDALNQAVQFEEKVGFDGIILTKLDGDSRGGAALSAVKVTGKPIYFTTDGEKVQNFQEFYPERMATRILGMGDVLTLVEKAQAEMDLKKTEELEKKLAKAQFDLSDFLSQIEEAEKLGPMTELLKYLPGGAKLKALPFDERKIKHMKAIIQSMTLEERKNPSIIKGRRKERIAKGSGTSLLEVNQLLRGFEESKKIMKKMAKGRSKLPFSFGKDFFN